MHRCYHDNTQSAYVGQHFLGSGHSFFTDNYYTMAKLITKFVENKTLTWRMADANSSGLLMIE